MKMRLATATVVWLGVGAILCPGQLPPARLQPATTAAFDRYTKNVEQQLSTRWHGQTAFLSLDDIPGERQKVLAGEFSIRSGAGGEPPLIPGGLIHDWVGSVFIPNVSVTDVVKVLQDFDRHSQFYPAISSSKLKSRQGNHLVGHWRLDQKRQMIPLVLDVDQDEEYEQIAPGKWVCRSHGRNISEVEGAGSANEKILAPGEGQGLVWRLDGYWSLQAVENGVLAECRSVSLSRGVPGALAWMIKPMLQSFSSDSLTSTLKETRDAAVQVKSEKVLQ